MRQVLAVTLLMWAGIPALASDEVVLTFQPDPAVVLPDGVSSAQLNATADRLRERFKVLAIDADVTVEDPLLRIRLKNADDSERATRVATSPGNLCFYLGVAPHESLEILRAVDQASGGQLMPLLSRQSGHLDVRSENVAKVQALVRQAGKKPGTVPEGKKILLGAAQSDGTQALYVLDAPPALCGGIGHAVGLADPNNPGHAKVLVRFTPEASARFSDITEKNVNRVLAIVIDERVLSAPVIRSRIAEAAEITGSFSQATAAELAAALESGPLPLSLVKSERERP